MLGKSIEAKLISLYGEESGKQTFVKLKKLVENSRFKTQHEKNEPWTEKDVALITYADSFQEKSVFPLITLNKLLSTFVGNSFSIVHILPFVQFSSDRGFSVIDYYKVKKEFGNWSNIRKIANSYRMMADLVANHVSVKNKWFRGFLKGDPRYRNFFIWFKEEDVNWDDIKKVIRKRATPLLTPFVTSFGKRLLWTTYSVGDHTDQVDLNYKNPEVLIEMVKVMLNTLSNNARVIRLDAVAGLWKELGTTCLHLPQTHMVISIFRWVIDTVCPSAFIVTESSMVTHTENMSYLGDGTDEAHAIYNFPLPSLVLQSFISGKADHLTEWASQLSFPSNKNTFFNFLDNHDGIDATGGQGFISQEEIQSMFDVVKSKGGVFSYKLLSGGIKAVKEMHMTWWSAINSEGEPFDTKLNKFLTSRAISMSLPGIPLIYYLSLFGAKNDKKAYEKTGIGRDIQRTNLNFTNLKKQLSNKNSHEAKVFRAMMDLIEKRKGISAFHPNAKQEILNLDKRLFAILRGEGNNRVLALHNVSKDSVEVKYKGHSFLLEPFTYIWQKI